ncbi:hypothetical protein T4E_4548 [Trichinella pseudospiralis]|uniref:Uncharacterized protein n=1 Tax=Trichinella pseudospiralis TaxID=6337 RepID=A0A0V0XQE7_TRIPS|nr:hypothetical protein T4E_4548 [Trichinella pseudospiralis]
MQQLVTRLYASCKRTPSVKAPEGWLHCAVYAARKRIVLTSLHPASSKKFVEVMKVLRNHFMPISSVSTLFVPADEGVASYLAELRHLAQHCNFGETDQLVCGLPDGNLQNQLLTDRELTFAKVLERALLAEVAIAQASGI